MLTTEERFWAKVNKTDTCWLWTAYTNRYGYGQCWDGTRLWQAHRYAYTILVGPIPQGLQLDHLCRVRNCVNPEHLEPVTNKENSDRAPRESYGKHWRSKTECPVGHPYDEENTKRYRGSRACRTCLRTRSRERKARLREDAKRIANDAPTSIT